MCFWCPTNFSRLECELIVCRGLKVVKRPRLLLLLELGGGGAGVVPVHRGVQGLLLLLLARGVARLLIATVGLKMKMIDKWLKNVAS